MEGHYSGASFTVAVGNGHYIAYRQTPATLVPANGTAPPALSERMIRSVGCVVSAVQVRPPSVERNTPAPPVPASNSVPLAERARMIRLVGCVAAGAQVTPPSVERNTPPPPVPA